MMEAAKVWWVNQLTASDISERDSVEQLPTAAEGHAFFELYEGETMVFQEAEAICFRKQVAE